MLEVKNLTINDLNGKEIIKNVNFTLNKNDKLAIIGEEGNGKSTLLKYIYNYDLVKDYVDIVDGKIIKNNIKLGYLEQFLNYMWNDYSVLEFFLKENVDSNINFEIYSHIYIIEKIFKDLRLNTLYLDEDKKIGNLSGGEKVKLQLAKLIFSNPDVLLLDEPTNDLDVETLIWLEDFIKAQTIPVIFISHDKLLLENVSNAILHIERINNKQNSRVTYENIGYKEYIIKRQYLLDRQENIAQNERREYNKQLEKFRRMYDKVNHELNNVSRQMPSKGRLLKKKMKSVKAFEKRLDKVEIARRPEVEEHIVAKFHNEDNIHDKKVILDFYTPELVIDNSVLSQNINLKVIGKEKVCIIGKNGCGKTTLIKEIYNVLKSRKDIKVGYMPQNYEDIFLKYKTPIEFLTKEYTKEERTSAITYLNSMKFTNDEIFGDISNLSGGQKAKLFIVDLIMKKCNVLLLDEPTRNLSPLSTPVINNLLKDYKGAIISVSHDRIYILEVCDSIYILDEKGLKKENLFE